MLCLHVHTHTLTSFVMYSHDMYSHTQTKHISSSSFDNVVGTDSSTCMPLKKNNKTLQSTSILMIIWLDYECKINTHTMNHTVMKNVVFTSKHTYMYIMYIVCMTCIHTCKQKQISSSSFDNLDA